MSEAPADMRTLVSGLPDQLRWAASLEHLVLPGASEVLVCGMGGSGISGDYLARLVDGRVAVHKGYELPEWVASSKPLVVAISYSGDTEETLSAAARAIEIGVSVAVVTSGGALGALAGEQRWPVVAVPGGLPPRAALGYLLGATLRVAEGAGLVAEVAGRLEMAARAVERLVVGPGWVLAADLAEGLYGRVAALYAADGPAAAVAGRWKTQINENAKRPAWVSVLPELDHNEVEAWTGLPDIGKRTVGVVALRTEVEPEAIERRFAVTRQATSPHLTWVGEAWGRGRTALERMLTLTAIGDMTSVLLAEQVGVDPLGVPTIEELKRLMREDHE